MAKLNLKNHSIEQLEKLFAQIEKEKGRRSKDMAAAKKKILSMMKEFSLSVADFAEAELKKSAKKKTRRKKAKRKSTKKAVSTAAKAVSAKGKKAVKKATTKKTTAKKKTRKKVAPKFANPDDKSMQWTGRGRRLRGRW